LVKAWDTDEIIDLYRAGGWWKDEYEPSGIADLISGSFAFAVAVDPATGSAVGMGRIISDGVSDGYIQDLVVLPKYRRGGVGSMIVSELLEACRAGRLVWIGVVAEQGSEQIYTRLGFRQMTGIPLLYDNGDSDAHD
jgi:ribosomal protein S18 acetylase RimI-like enzyme